MKILFIQRKSTNCGVADYGKRLFSILKPAMDITMCECEAMPDLTGYDIALWNYHHATMPWADCSNKSVKHVALFHEAFQNITPDVWIPVSELARPLPEKVDYDGYWENDDTPVIGSFGFGFTDKDYIGIAKMVKREFEEAILKLHIPFAEYGDADGSQAVNRALECKIVLSGTGIKLKVEHKFMPPDELVEWLSENDLNFFNCLPTQGRGISSSIDYALSARRPIAISNSEMYRHLPREICVDNISLPRLIEKGIEPLREVYAANTNEILIEQMKEWLKK